MTIKEKIKVFFFKLFNKKKYKQQQEQFIRNKQYIDYIISEYNLICKKKSSLSSGQRQIIIKKVDYLVANGVLSKQR